MQWPAALREPRLPHVETPPCLARIDCGKFAFARGIHAPPETLAPAARRGTFIEMRVTVQRELVATRQAPFQQAVETRGVGYGKAVKRRHYQKRHRDIRHRGDCLQQTLAQWPCMRRYIMHRYA